MTNAKDYTGKKIGIWRVLEKTNKRDSAGRIVYLVENTRTHERILKSTNFLAMVQRRGSKTDKVGRPRKWIIIKKPYIPEEE